MIRFILALIVLVICGAIGYFIKTFPAMVNIRLPEHTLSTNLIIWCIVSLIAAWIIMLLFKFFVFLWRSPQIFSRNAKTRKRHKANKLLRNGMSELLAGHYKKAEKHLVKGADLAEEVGESSVIYFENAAIAADKLQANARRDQYLIKARQEAGQQHTALTRLSEAELHASHGDFDKALPLLEKLHQQESKNAKIIGLLDEAYVAQEQWQNAWSLLPKLRPYLPVAEYEARRKTYAKGMLADTDAIESVAELNSAWRKLPAEIRRDDEMIMLYAGSLIENGHSEEAERILANEIKNSQDLKLIQAYSQLSSADAHRQLANMENWSTHHPNDATFLHALARVAYRAKDYDKASQAIEASISRQPVPEAFALWALILEAKNEPQAALAAYRQSVVALPGGEQSIEGDLLPVMDENKALPSS
ncbi:heme biosynthesis protein HemY [Suttonella sp. R2A3]|uniref:heme biosynthesis HemY N-terminal domain-containing protein n=1 Tax=Suttonella sp. R2A3 TaxID=2908648 RepID=UPI001F1FEDF5|nr:heme biosynthesis HemY N-terminal domain-containing protein [Suttonella sp. R2A3]UJF25092.1 heme biosynthesis protein HemY [Suttonella sp. R2A3]